MKKNRYIPFGYMMRNGDIVLNESESTEVRQIFDMYLSGSSLKTIASAMTKAGIPYIDGKTGWNKNMIARILENDRYCGNNGFPALVSEDEYCLANQKKGSKVPKKPNVLKLECIRKKAFCLDCGGRLRRDHDKWFCPAPECASKVVLTDNSIADFVLRLLNAGIADPELLQTPSEYQPDIEIIRLQNEIHRALEMRDFDPQAIKARILELAQLKYAACPDDGQSIISLFADRDPLVKWDPGFFDTVVKKVLVAVDGAVYLRLKNQISLALPL